MLKFIEKIIDKLDYRAPDPAVVCDDEGVTRFLSRNRQEYLCWADLEEVAIITTDEGPFVEDVYWMLIDAHDEAGRPASGVALPACDVEDAVRDHIFALPGFDYERFIQAMGSTSNDTFVCWTSDQAVAATTSKSSSPA